jgi:hypothetical protein
VLATALVLAGATLAARAAGLVDTLDVVVAAPVLAATQIVATLLFAGVVLGHLDRPIVLILNAVVTGAALVAFRGHRPARPAPGAFGRAVSASRANLLATALVMLAALALAWRLVLALVLPPYGYDALAYHLPTVVDWLQAGRIARSPLNACCAYYPENGEVLVAWTAVLARRAELMDVVQIAMAVVGAAAVAGIARAARLPAAGAWIAAALFVVTPILLAQSNTAYVDVTFAAEALAGLYFVLRYLEATGRARWALLGCAGAATALCVGTKPSGVVLGVAVAAPLAVKALARRRVAWREAGLVAALFVAPVAALGLSWYLRSWIETGNPFYPQRVQLLGATLFDGKDYLSALPPQIVRRSHVLQPVVSWYTDLHFWTRSGYSHDQRLGGLGPVWSYLGVGLLVVFAVHAWLRRRLVFWYFLVPLAIFFLLQPYDWWSRFTLPLAGGAAVAVAWAITSWRAPQLRLALGVATLVLAAAGALLASKTVIPGVRFHALGAKTVLSNALHGRRSVGRVFYPDYAWLDKVGGSSRVAIDIETVHMTSPLAGARFEHRLLTLPRRGDLADFVRTQRVQFVVTRKGSYYDRLIERGGPAFERVGGRRVLAYRVIPA